ATVLLTATTLLLAACGGDAVRSEPNHRDAAQGAARFPGWNTDFARRSVGLGEFKDGGPPRDGIPPIDRPRVATQRQGDRYLDDREPVMVVQHGAAARAYPLRILVWHEIVNDRLAGRAIAVTYCPLCNSGVVFDRRVDGRELTFGTTGKLRRSDLVMWDRQTESWWQQFSGEALVGTMTGRRLRMLASQTLSWQDFKHIYPQGTVLSQDTGFVRDYGRNPYEGYDSNPNGQPFALDRAADRRLPPKERVVLIRSARAATVIPFSRLQQHRVAVGRVGSQPYVVLFKRGVLSALDAGVITDSRDVGTAAAFDPRTPTRVLTFAPAPAGAFADRQTGSTWDITGRAVRGPLAGERLRPLHHDEQFWFAVAAFLPAATIAGR
ncbi:MAG: DUF3179 domain-containing protein, partial [Solirubrobacteraceae bacterium]